MAEHTVSPAQDQWGHTRQAPISSPRFCVLYLRDGREKSTPWFSNGGNAQRALALMQQRYGKAVIFRD